MITNGGARRQSAQEGLRNGGNLSHGGLDVDARVEKDFHDRNSVERLRFDVFNIVDEYRNASLNVGGDALLHLLGFEARVGPHLGDDRNVDFREYIRRGAHQDNGSHEYHDERHNDKRVWPG